MTTGGVYQIEQTRGALTRNYRITSDGVKAEIKTGKRYRCSTIKFDEIGFEECIIGRKPHPIEKGLFVSVSLNIVFLLLMAGRDLSKTENGPSIISNVVIAIVAGLFAWSVTLFKRRTIKVLKGEKNIYFLYDEKEKEEVDVFIQVLQTAKTEYFKSKFTVQDAFEPLEDVPEYYL